MLDFKIFEYSMDSWLCSIEDVQESHVSLLEKNDLISKQFNTVAQKPYFYLRGNQRYAIM